MAWIWLARNETVDYVYVNHVHSKSKKWAGMETALRLLINSTVQLHPYLRAIDHVSQQCKTTEI